MLFLRFMLLVIGFGVLAIAAGIVLYDLCLAFELDRLLRRGGEAAKPADQEAAAEQRPAAQRSARRTIRWGAAARLAAIAIISMLAGASIVVVPDGRAAVRISQISGVRPGTLYAGTHFIVPLFERVDSFDVRDRVFATSATEGPHEKLECLTVEAREGLSVGLAVTVRYRIDPKRLDYIQANLPQPVDEQIVAPVVTSVFREMAPNYIVRDLFATKREEFRSRAAQEISRRLGGDAIVVKEVLLRKVLLPEDYAKGLQDLLLKEEEDDQTSVEADIEQKRVKIAESQAEALKVRQLKRAEGDAQTQVLMAKAQSDSMQYTLPLKQKQIEQSKLEAEARKEATIQNAEAAAQAKVIDSKAEQERETLLADAEANRIRVTAKAQSEEMQMEAAALSTNPLLIQYTVAQKLSDKVQIMLVPSDGKFFFTNDVLRSAMGEPSAEARVEAGQEAPPSLRANVRP
jgi:regulator of protease activity HflC (stomatin/prohibitin superfamily)